MPTSLRPRHEVVLDFITTYEGTPSTVHVLVPGTSTEYPSYSYLVLYKYSEYSYLYSYFEYSNSGSNVRPGYE